MNEEYEHLVDASDLATVAEAATEFEANAIRVVLQDAGIPNVCPPCGTSLFGFPLGVRNNRIAVKVLPEDLPRAREALAQARFTGRSVDWDDVDVGEMPPEVRAVLERGALPRRAGSVMAKLGAALAVLLALCTVGGILMWFIKSCTTARGLALTLSAGLLAAAAGCGYRLEGRVMEGFGTAQVVSADQASAHGRPVPGAHITLTRDHRSTSREVVATTTSGPDGTFVLTVDAFGAGWMQEEWLVRASRGGYRNVETTLHLPASANGQQLVITMDRGRSEPFREPDSQRSLMEEARRYEPGLGSSVR